MLSRAEKAHYRNELFRHLDGIATAPVALALQQKGVLDFLLKKNHYTIEEITEEFEANEGYLNVALRIMASQGWLDYSVDNQKNKVTVSKNEKSAIAFAKVDRYTDMVKFLKLSENFHPRNFDLEQFTALNRIFQAYQNGEYDATSEHTLEHTIEAQIQKHIEGALIGPITVHLGMDGMFHKYFMEASFSADEFHEDPVSFSKILDFFSFLGWFRNKNGHYKFTDKGLFFARRASAYGVTVSYLPTFRRVDELIFGNANIFEITK